MNPNAPAWYRLDNADAIPSPAVLVFPDRVEANLRRMIAIAGGPERLCPHVKTHKLAEIVRRQRAHGIDRFKCATIAEAEMVAGTGAMHVLLAMQAVGPNIARLVQLVGRFPQTRFGTLVDDAGAARRLSAATAAAGASVDVLLDIDCGMSRTGVAPGAVAIELYRVCTTLPGLRVAGLHAYDGHIHDTDPARRMANVRAAMAPVLALREELARRGLRADRLVAGGTPTLPIHALTAGIECSPGTCVLWDGWSAAALPDLNFEPAAVLLTRVVSKPGSNRICLDLGYKAVASEMNPPRVQFFDLPSAVPVMHNEEHLVLETPVSGDFAPGDVLYGLPWHICPTMALHAYTVVVRDGHATDRWRVAARDRALSI